MKIEHNATAMTQHSESIWDEKNGSRAGPAIAAAAITEAVQAQATQPGSSFAAIGSR
jgi:hypothetical protein